MWLALLGWAAISHSSKAADMSAIPSYLINPAAPADVQKMETEGRLSDAEARLDALIQAAAARPTTDTQSARNQATANPAAGNPAAGNPAAEHEVLIRERERLRRLRRDFSLNDGEVLDKVRKSIPGATPADLRRWREEGVIQWISLGGAIRYFRREPVNLFRFSGDAQARRDAAQPPKAAQPAAPAAPPADSSTSQPSALAPAPPAAAPVPRPAASDPAEVLNLHLAEALERAAQTGQNIVLPKKFRFNFTLTVPPGTVPEGEILRCWIPFPQDYRQQGDMRLLATTPTLCRVAPNGAAHRTIYLEQPAAPAKAPTIFCAAYEFTCAAFVPAIDPGRVEPPDAANAILSENLQERPPQIVFTPALRQLAAGIVGDEQNPFRKAERIYCWIDKNIQYAAEMEYAILPSVAEKVLATRKGDCGAQVLLFIALCRASGVPARWQSGWEMKPGAPNMHDWAEFWAAPYGWLPADPSYGLRESANPGVRNFYIGHLDSYRLIANLDFDRPFDPPMKFWRADPVDNQRGEIEWRKGALYYDQWKYDVQITPLEP